MALSKHLFLGLSLMFTLFLGLVTTSAVAAPTRPFFAGESKSTTATKELELQAIFIKKQGSSAVINDQVVREGDTVNGARIKRITQGEVHFLRNQRIGVLKLNKSVVEKMKVGV